MYRFCSPLAPGEDCGSLRDLANSEFCFPLAEREGSKKRRSRKITIPMLALIAPPGIIVGTRSLPLSDIQGFSHGLQANGDAPLRQGVLPSNRPRSRPVRQRADGQVGQIRRRHRLRRLGRSQLGTRPLEVRDRRRRGSLRQGTGQVGTRSRLGDLHHRHAFARSVFGR